MQSLGIIPHHLQATAFLGAVRSKRAHDDIATRPDGVQHALDVGSSVLGGRQKVKKSAIVPYIDGMPWQRKPTGGWEHPVGLD